MIEWEGSDESETLQHLAYRFVQDSIHTKFMIDLQKFQQQLAPVQLLVVTKKRSVHDIRAVIGAGIKDLGENTLQEIQKKYDQDLLRELQKKQIKLHYIGDLQTKKIRKIVSVCDVIQSVDSLEKALKISQVAGELKKRMLIFLELNVTGEEQKHGMKWSDDEGGSLRLREEVEGIRRLPHVQLMGFMCMGKQNDPDETRKAFKKCAQLAREHELPEVSMGMSEDYPIALEEGSTMVRLGSVIFE